MRLESHKQIWYVPVPSAPRLGCGDGDPPIDPSGVTFLAPLDPFMWDRRLIEHLFGFEYLWEVYVPEHKRRWGYYVLPILFGERLVGRIEPRLERKTGVLRILGIWWETGFAPRAEEGFVEQMRAALGEYMDFVGAKTVEWAPATSGAKRLFGTPRRRPG